MHSATSTAANQPKKIHPGMPCLQSEFQFLQKLSYHSVLRDSADVQLAINLNSAIFSSMMLPIKKTHKNKVVANKNRHQSFLVNYSKKPL